MNRRRVDLEADVIKQEGIGNGGSVDRLLPAVHDTSWVVRICTRPASSGRLEVMRKAGEGVRVCAGLGGIGQLGVGGASNCRMQY